MEYSSILSGAPPKPVAVSPVDVSPASPPVPVASSKEITLVAPGPAVPVGPGAQLGVKGWRRCLAGPKLGVRGDEVK